MPAPTLVVAAGAFNDVGATGASATTASVSWQTGDVVIACVGTAGAVPDTLSVSNTGSGISFGTAQQIHNSTGSNAGGACWAAVATANSSGTFTGSETGATEAISIVVFIWRGSAGVGNSAISVGSGRTVNLTPLGADGAISWCVFDWAAAAVQSFSPTSTTHGSGTPGPTALPVSTSDGTQYTYYYACLDDQASAGTNAYGIGGSGTGPFTIIAIEAKASVGGAALLPARPGKTWQRRFHHHQRQLFVPAAAGNNFTQNFSAGLSFTSSQSHGISKTMAAGLSFTSSIKNVITKLLPVAVLSFTSSISKAITKSLPGATLSFTSSLVTGRFITKLLTATLSFTSSQTHSIGKVLTGGLSFTSSQSRATGKLLAATLSFTSAQPRSVASHLAGVLSFTSSQTRATSKLLATASLSFTGSLAPHIVLNKLFTATLSFTGSLTPHIVLNKLFTATLSFTSSQSRNISKLVPAALSFTSSQSRRISKTLAAGLSFTSAENRAIRKTLAAGLSFNGSLVQGRLLLKMLTAALSFNGSITKRTGKSLAGSLGFTSSIATATTSVPYTIGRLVSSVVPLSHQSGAITASRLVNALLPFSRQSINIRKAGGPS
jgi:hypothetical protein